MDQRTHRKMYLGKIDEVCKGKMNAKTKREEEGKKICEKSEKKVQKLF